MRKNSTSEFIWMEWHDNDACPIHFQWQEMKCFYYNVKKTSPYQAIFIAWISHRAICNKYHFLVAEDVSLFSDGTRLPDARLAVDL